MAIARRQFLSTLFAAGSAAPAFAQNERPGQAPVPAGAPRPPQAATAGPRRDASPETQPAAAARRGDPWIEISAANLVWNLRQIEQRAGKPVMAVVKANAYGHGLAPVARRLADAGVRHFLVGNLEEALRLRAAGARGSILNFGPFAEADAEEIVRRRISQNVFDDRVNILRRAAQRLGVGVRVQVKVDTGLGRFGVPHEQAGEFLDRVAYLPSVGLEGVFTTLTEDADFDAVQLARFLEVTERTRKWGHDPVLRSAASSAAILDFPPACAELDVVRPGIMLYGLYPSTRAAAERKLDLRPVLALKARVAQVKTLRPGESAGYHRAFVAAREERIALVPAGYSDGLPRALAAPAASGAAAPAGGAVLIRGVRCPVLAISSNAVIVRLLDGAAASQPGDLATFLGGDAGAPGAAELAALAGSSVYAVAMAFSPSLPRLLV